MPKTVYVLCVNDFHAEIMEGEVAPGCAKLAGALRDFTAAHPDTLLVFGGDNYRGDPISEQADGAPVTALMRALGVKLSALGNHELDFGAQALRRWQAAGDYTFLAANLYEAQTGRPADFVKPYETLSCGGFQIAFLGLATQEPLDTPARPADLHALTLGDGTEAARRWVTHLREGRDRAGRPDAILALTHYGLKRGGDGALEGEELLALCQSVPELDGAFAAHWHQFMAERIDGVPVAQGGCRGQGFARLALTFGDDGALLSVEPSYVDLRTQISALPVDLTLSAVVKAAYAEAMETLGQVVGLVAEDLPHRDPETNEVPVQGTALTALAVRVMRDYTGADVALFYSGWIIGGLRRGPVTLYHLYDALRFHTLMVSMRLPGRVLLRNLELGLRTLKGEGASPLAVGGLRIVADMSRPHGQRLISARLSDGRALEADRFYSVVTDDSLAEGGMGFDFSAGTERVYHEPSVRACMVELIRREGTVPPPPETVALVWRERGGTDGRDF